MDVEVNLFSISNQKTKEMKKIIILLMMVIAYYSGYAGAGNVNVDYKRFEKHIDTLTYNVYRGKIIDGTTRERLNFASIMAKGTNIATVSNSEGEFLLKVTKNIVVDSLEISHIGYKNVQIACKQLGKKRNLIRLMPVEVRLEEVNIYPLNPEELVRGILKNMSANYAQNPNMMEGFYRESIRKNRNYVAISEAVVNIYKSGYRQLRGDQIQIYKGRKSRDVKRMDTLLFKLQGGPFMALQLDVVRNPQGLLSPSAMGDYNFRLKTITEINGRLHYVIQFKQKKEVEYPLYAGVFYIECDNLALTGAKFSVNMENVEEVRRMFVRKKPSGVKITPVIAEYMVNYRETNGKWYFTYSRGYLKFKCNWKRKLFNSNYMVTTELAITDRDTIEIERFKYKERFRRSQVLVDNLSDFQDVNFWGNHNTIEPEQSIEAAIRKIKRRAGRKK